MGPAKGGSGGGTGAAPGPDTAGDHAAAHVPAGVRSLADDGLVRVRAAGSAPAKCILLGEHAVVYGQPCLSVALDLRTTVVARAVGDDFTVNGYPLDRRFHAYFKTALEQVWPQGPAVRFETHSDIPSTSGMGSSAALSVATVGALERLRGDWGDEDLPGLARASFLAERRAQRSGSPNDTSVSTAGGAILLAPERRRDAGLTHLWTAELPATAEDPGADPDEVIGRWEVHRVEAPRLRLVLGVTGVRGKTSTQVAKVRRFVERSGLGKDTVKDIGAYVIDALDALREEDLPRLGGLMDRCQVSLHTMGVNHPALQRLIDAAQAAHGTFGAKLTGAGGGGAMVCLTMDEDAAVAAIEAAGGTAIRAPLTGTGLRPELELELRDALPETTTPVVPDDGAAPAAVGSTADGGGL